MARDDVDWQSAGKGPVCTECKSNAQVLKAELTYTPKLRIPFVRHSHLPVGFPKTVTGWWCHNDKHENGNYVGPA